MKNDVKTERRTAAALSGKEGVIAAAIGVLLAALYAFSLPGALLRNLYIGDVDAAYIARYGTYLLTALLGVVLTRLLLPRFRAGFRTGGLGAGWRAYGFAAAAAFLLTYLGLMIGLRPFNARPSLGDFLAGGVCAYLCAALLEEFIYRGLLLRALSSLLPGDGAARLLPVLISALLFTAGRLPALAGLTSLRLVCAAIQALGLGLFLGAVFLRTGNLLLTSLFHFLNLLSGAAFFFTRRKLLPTLPAAVCIAVYVLLGAYGVYLAVKRPGEARDGRE